MTIHPIKVTLKDKNNNYIVPYTSDGTELLHSTFDKSKFTVVGSPTITEDGIASGFSYSNYVNAIVPIFTANRTFVYEGAKVKASALPASGTIYTVQEFGAVANEMRIGFYFIGSKMRSFMYLGTTQILYKEFDVTANTYYQQKFVWNGTVINMYIKEGDGDYELAGSYNNTEAISFADNHAYLGVNRQGLNVGATLQIDLKSFSITVDGVEVFNGNKTGLDTIKSDNYTVVGSPTISEDGILTTTSTNAQNYIYSASKIDATNAAKFSMELEFEVKDIGGTTANQLFLMNFGHNGINGTPNFQLINTTLYMYVNKNLSLNDNDKIRVYVDITTETENNLRQRVYRNDSLVKDIYVTYSGNWQIDDYIYFGYRYSGTAKCNVNLSSAKVYLDGNLVYQPCLKIPYTEAKTGAKVVNATYRDRVEDCYEQFGTGNYYTIDEENKNFTLPYDTTKGECRVIKSYRTGITSYEYNTNLECIQTGSCTADTAVTFPKAFADTDYALSVPYTEKTTSGFTPSQTGDWIAKGRITLG